MYWLGLVLVVLGIVLILVQVYLAVRDANAAPKPAGTSWIGVVIGEIAKKYPMLAAGLVLIVLGLFIMGALPGGFFGGSSPSPSPS